MKDVRLGGSLGSFHGAKTGCLEKAEEDQNSTGKQRQGQVQDSGAEKHSRKQKRMKTMKVIRTDSRNHGVEEAAELRVYQGTLGLLDIF